MNNVNIILFSFLVAVLTFSFIQYSDAASGNAQAKVFCKKVSNLYYADRNTFMEKHGNHPYTEHCDYIGSSYKTGVETDPDKIERNSSWLEIKSSRDTHLRKTSDNTLRPLFEKNWEPQRSSVCSFCLKSDHTKSDYIKSGFADLRHYNNMMKGNTNNSLERNDYNYGRDIVLSRENPNIGNIPSHNRPWN